LLQRWQRVRVAVCRVGRGRVAVPGAGISFFDFLEHLRSHDARRTVGLENIDPGGQLELELVDVRVVRRGSEHGAQQASVRQHVGIPVSTREVLRDVDWELAGHDGVRWVRASEERIHQRVTEEVGDGDAVERPVRAVGEAHDPLVNAFQL
jgi:hypothetical protein